MEKLQSNPFSSYRHNFIDITAIYGVDIETGTVADHPLFPNPKSYLREDIVESLVDDLSHGRIKATDVVPIDVLLTDAGELIVVDGKHRLTAFAVCAKRFPDDATAFRKIKINRVHVPEASVRFESVRRNLVDGRSNLTDAEESAFVYDMLQRGFSKEDIVQKLGVSFKRLANRIDAVVTFGVPGLTDAVLSGEIDSYSASRIAKTVDVSEQSQAIEDVKELTEQTGSATAARKATNLHKARRPVLSRSEIEEKFKDYGAVLGVEDQDPFLLGMITALGLVFKFDIDDTEGMKELYDELILAEQEKLAKVSRKPSPKKRSGGDS